MCGKKKNARQLVQKEIGDMKDEIKNIEMGSSSTVCSEANTGVWLGSGTFVDLPSMAARWADPWVPRKLEFKGGIRILRRNSRRSSKNTPG